MIAISSTQNPYIKNILKLQEKSRERKKQGLFIIEGKREISLAIKGKYKFEAILYNKDLITENEISHLFDENIKRVEISKEVYQKIAYRDSTEGIVAVAKTKTFSIEDIHFKNNKPVISDPGLLDVTYKNIAAKGGATHGPIINADINPIINEPL